jgi:hypothetical protein
MQLQQLFCPISIVGKTPRVPLLGELKAALTEGRRGQAVAGQNQKEAPRWSNFVVYLAFALQASSARNKRLQLGLCLRPPEKLTALTQTLAGWKEVASRQGMGVVGGGG